MLFKFENLYVDNGAVVTFLSLLYQEGTARGLQMGD